MERMGIRARSNNNLLLKSEEEDEDAKSSGQKGALITTRLWRELGELWRAALRLAKGEGTVAGYVLLIPGGVCALWMLLAFLTSSRPNYGGIDIDEEELREAIAKGVYVPEVYENAHMDLSDYEEELEPVDLPEGQSVNVVFAMPFLDHNPLAATEYISTLEWIIIYSHVPVAFHVITNTDSKPFVEKIFTKIDEKMKGPLEGALSLGDYTFEVLTLAEIVDTMSESVCLELLASDNFCDVLMGKMTPLMFPYLFPQLDHAIFVHRTMIFNDDIGKLWNVFKTMRETGREAIAMAAEQTNLYMRAFAGWQKVNPTTRLGRPPPEGRPGFNPDLMVMDLERLRESDGYFSYFSERRVKSLIGNYLFHTEGEIPSLGDMVNMIAADDSTLFRELGCEWNRNSDDIAQGDVLAAQFDACVAPHGIRAWNGPPNAEKAKRASWDKRMSIGKAYRGDDSELK